MRKLIRHYDTVEWTLETWPKSLTFDMKCDNELSWAMDRDSKGEASCLCADAPETVRLERDGFILRQRRVSWGENRFVYALNKQAALAL